MLITFHCFKLFNHSNVMNDVQDTKSNQNKDEDSHIQTVMIMMSMMMTRENMRIVIGWVIGFDVYEVIIQ